MYFLASCSILGANVAEKNNTCFFFGHTHFLTFYTENNKFAFNPGSLGVSRDGNPRLTFSLLKPESLSIEVYEITHSANDFISIESTEPVLVTTFQL